MNKSWGVKVMENMRLLEIREAEKKSHMEMYSGAELFELGSWLQKPVKTVLDLFPLFTEHKELRVLDLGCGVGRNSIPIAKEFHTIPVTLECVDILELAIDKLYMNARQHDVEDNIKGIVSAIEDYPIVADGYDMIMAISALEHIDSKESFENKLFEIIKADIIYNEKDEQVESANHAMMKFSIPCDKVFPKDAIIRIQK